MDDQDGMSREEIERRGEFFAMVADTEEHWSEHWAGIVQQANERGGYNYSRLLFKLLIRYLRTGQHEALDSPDVRAFLADALEDGLNIKDARVGKALKITKNTKERGSSLDGLKREFITWYCERCEDATPTSKQISDWRIAAELKGVKMAGNTTFAAWKKAARDEFADKHSIYHMFKSVSTD